MRYENPRQINDIVMWAAVGTCSLAMGIWLLSGGVDVLSVGYTAILPTTFYLATFYRNYWHFPTSVDIHDNGIVLYYPLSRKREVSWPQIKSVYSNPGDLSTFIGRWMRAGGVELHGIRSANPLSYEISEVIRTKYREAMGRYPPEYQVR